MIRIYTCKEGTSQNSFTFYKKQEKGLLIRRTFSGGFVLFMRGSSVYNITDAVNGAFDSDALIFGEQSENSNSIVGQGASAYRWSYMASWFKRLFIIEVEQLGRVYNCCNEN